MIFKNISMHFDPQNTSPELTLSPSNLICTNIGTNDRLFYAVCNIGFTTGVHYFEFICPLSCESIQVGIVKKEFNIS